MRELHITPVLNGFVVKAGCQTVVFRSRLELAEAIAGYYANPVEFEKQFISSACNAKFMMGQGQAVDASISDQFSMAWEGYANATPDLRELNERNRVGQEQQQQQRATQGAMRQVGQSYAQHRYGGPESDVEVGGGGALPTPSTPPPMPFGQG